MSNICHSILLPFRSRPDFPREALKVAKEFYVFMKAKAQPQLTEDMKRVVNEQRLGFVASVCPDGTPNLSPKGSTTAWGDEHLMFADICSAGTLTNVQQPGVLPINVADPVARTVYRFKGPAAAYQEGP